MGTVDPEALQKAIQTVDALFSMQGRQRNNAPQIWLSFRNGECSILAAGLTSKLAFYQVEASVTSFVSSVADVLREIGPQAYGQCADGGLLGLIHSQHQSHGRTGAAEDGQMKSAILFMPETAEHQFHWNADNRMRRQCRRLGQGFVAYTATLLENDTTCRKLSVNDEDYMYLWKMQCSRTILHGIPQLHPDSRVDFLTSTMSRSLSGRDLSNSALINMSIILDVQRQLATEAKRPYQMLIQLAHATKSTPEKWLAEVSYKLCENMQDANDAIDFVLDYSHTRHLVTNPVLCSVMQLDML